MNNQINFFDLYEKADVHAHCFELDNMYYMYDYYYDVIIRISKEVKKCYEYFLEGNKEYKNYKIEFEFLQELFSEGLLISKYSLPDRFDDTAYISFAPVYGCNFRCKYCFGEHGENYLGTEKKFSIQLMKNVLNIFVDKWYPESKHYRVDFVSGGEPLLNFDMIKETIDYIEKMQKEKGKNISVWICTNGSLLNDEICTYLDAHNVSIGVSIDGEKKKHDKCRIDINGNGTYELVVEKIKKILNNKKYSRKFRNIWGLSVVSQNNYNILQIINHNKKLGLKNIQIKLVRSNNDDLDVEAINYEYYILCEKIYDEFVGGKFDIIKNIANNNDYFGKILKRILLHQVVDRRCWAGVKKVAVCPDGTVYPCDSFVGKTEFCLGNYKEIKQVDSTFDKMNVDNRRKCKECSIKYICGGDCYYNSYINNADIGLPSSKFCEIQKNIINRCIELKLRMLEYNKNLYDQIITTLTLKDGYMIRS